MLYRHTYKFCFHAGTATTHTHAYVHTYVCTYPSVPKKLSLVNHLVNPVWYVLLHKWRTSDTPYRQLYGMSAFLQVKIQMKSFRSPTGFHLFLIFICRMACHVPMTRPTWNHLWNAEYFQWVLTYEITCMWHVPSEITCKMKNFFHEISILKI